MMGYGLCALVLVCVLGMLLYVSPGCSSKEGFAGKTRSFGGVVGLHAKITTAVGGPVRYTRYTMVFRVDSKNKLVALPVIPYENQLLAHSLIRFKGMFGPRNVETVPVSKTPASVKPDKVVLEYDPKTQRVTQVLIPKRWSVPPDYLDVPLGTLIRLNPPQGGATVSGPHLDIRTNTTTGLITSAVLTT